MTDVVNCIVAVSLNMGIGKDGRLPWPKLSGEMRHFKKLTTASRPGLQNAVIMGKNTWFSIPEKNRPLKDRINVVLSTTMKSTPNGAHLLARSLDEALTELKRPQFNTDTTWVIGGSSVYRDLMNRQGHQKIFMTRIMSEFESDTLFPVEYMNKYHLIKNDPCINSDIQEENGLRYKFEVYEKLN